MVQKLKSEKSVLFKKCSHKLIFLNDFFFHFTGNGYISTDVLKEILQELDAKLTNEDLDNIIEEVDEDGSGTLGIKDLISKNDSIAFWFPRSEFLKNSWSRLRLF
mgnify:CR=1 FL=1